MEQLKEHIAETIQIPSEAQRCIHLGQILQNDMKLADCGKYVVTFVIYVAENTFLIKLIVPDVDGKVIHVVQRPPPSSAYDNDSPNANNSNNTSDNTNGPTPGRRFEHTGTMYLGMAFPNGIMDEGIHIRRKVEVNFTNLKYFMHRIHGFRFCILSSEIQLIR